MTGPVKFTPGPLTANDRRLESGSLIVAYEIVGDHTTFDGDAANAAEIALRWNAHLDLLAACERTVEIIQGGDRFGKLEPWAQEIVTEIRAVIAKATGGAL